MTIASRTTTPECEVRGCGAPARLTVQTHRLRAPEYANVCREHARWVELIDRCIIENCDQRAHRYGVCAIHLHEDCGGRFRVLPVGPKV